MIMNIRHHLLRLAAAAVLLAIPSCVIPRSYPDPKLHAAAPASVSLPKPATLSVEVGGQTNGKSRSAVSKFFKKEFEKAFAKIPNLTLAEGGGKVHILANNRADTKEAAKKGAASGLTMGIMGVEVTDHYEFTFTYTPLTGASFSRSYKHAVHSIIGATGSPPEGVTTTSIVAAVQVAVDDAAKSFIRDLAKSGKL